MDAERYGFALAGILMAVKRSEVYRAIGRQVHIDGGTERIRCE